MGTLARRGIDARLWIAVALIIVAVLGIVGYLYVSMRGATTVTTTVTSIATQTVTATKTSIVTETKVLEKVRTETVTRIFEKPVKVIDALGRSVEFEKVPKRVVCLAPSITELVFALGLGRYVVGVDSFSNYPPIVLDLVKSGRIAVVGGYWNPDVEKIVALKPDLVLASAGVPSHVALESKLRESGIKVVYLRADRARDLSDIVADIQLVAQIFHAEDNATKLVKKIVTEIQSIANALKSHNATKVRVLVLLSPPSYGLWTTGGGTFIDYLVTVAGGRNVFGDKHGWVQASPEDIVARNPQVIIVTAMGVNATTARQIIEDLLKIPGISEVEAAKKGRIYVLTGEADDMLTRPGPRISKAVLLLAKILHPEIFGEPQRSDVYSAKQLGVAVAT